MVELRNRGLVVEINEANGALAALTNRLTGERYGTTAIPFRLDTSVGRIEPRQANGNRHTDTGAEFTYRAGGMDITLAYCVPPDQDYLERTIEVRNAGAEPLVIYEVVPEEIEFAPNFVEIHPHRDPGMFEGLINLFLRSEQGGLYFGVANPVFTQANRGVAPGNTWVRLSYRPHWLLAPGESYCTDQAFLGSYRNEGIYLFRELGKLRRALSEPSAVPSALSFSQQVLDWGEVWAMQGYVRALQPAHDFRRPGYYVRAVAMVGGAQSAATGADPAGWHIAFGPEHVAGSKRFIDDVARLGHIAHIEWATEWFGLGGYAAPTPGLLLERAGPGTPVPVNPHWREVVEYGWSQGIETGIFETVTRSFAQDQPAWKVLRRDGEPWTWNTPPQPVNCWANPDYARWRLEVTDQAIRDYRLYMVAWDSSVPAYWTWLEWPTAIDCYATNHGHAPGDIRYHVFRNILRFTGELQARHPQLALRVAAGTTTAYPWVLRNLIEYHPNIYDGETGATFWISCNFRFLPMYKSGILLSATTDEAFRYLLLRSLSSSDHFMLWPDTVETALRNRDFWDQWLTWADHNLAYLRVGRTLFREPWGDGFVASLMPALEGSAPLPEASLNGSAHCIADRGFVFVFNPSQGTRIGAVPINHRLGLTEGDRFAVRELFPTGGREWGVYGRGAELRIAVAPETAMVLEIAPAGRGATARAPSLPEAVPVDKAFVTWDEIPWPEVMG